LPVLGSDATNDMRFLRLFHRGSRAAARAAVLAAFLRVPDPEAESCASLSFQVRHAAKARFLPSRTATVTTGVRAGLGVGRAVEDIGAVFGVVSGVLVIGDGPVAVFGVVTGVLVIEDGPVTVPLVAVSVVVVRVAIGDGFPGAGLLAELQPESQGTRVKTIKKESANFIPRLL
jgi:hypothetical protein